MSEELEPLKPSAPDSPREREQQLAQHAQRNCGYCRAELSPYYYFCPRCATPYKPLETVLPQLPQPYEDDEMRIRYRAPQALNVYLIFLGVLIISSMVGFAIYPDQGVEHQLFVSVSLVLCTVVMSIVYWSALQVQLVVPGLLRKEFLIAFPILAGMLLLNYAYHSVLWEYLSPGLGEDEAGYDDLIPSYAGQVIMICILPGIIEEIAFRGLIQHWLHAAVTPLKAITLASILFSAAHFSMISAPYLFLVGMLLGWLRWKTGSLYPSMIIHFLHNFVVISYF